MMMMVIVTDYCMIGKIAHVTDEVMVIEKTEVH